MVVTFHGGMVAIGYEWGSLNHPKPNDGSPDDNANREIAAQLRAYAGARRNHRPPHRHTRGLHYSLCTRPLRAPH